MNTIRQKGNRCIDTEVQIPLWSMNTILGNSFCSRRDVQIPLWSMNTAGWIRDKVSDFVFRFLYGRWIHDFGPDSFNHRFMFRFLYGRWIPGQMLQEKLAIQRSDSSMVDEYDAKKTRRVFYNVCSDSSMVDEYALEYWLFPLSG